MKDLYKLSTFVLIILLAFLVWPQEEDKDSLKSITFAAAGELTKAVTPYTLHDQFIPGNTGSNEVTQSAVDYAIPTDMDIFNSTPSGTNNQGFTIYASIPVFQDLNGDGLADMIFAKDMNPKKYVLINNGHGFDVAYYCEIYSGKYYGHCAE